MESNIVNFLVMDTTGTCHGGGKIPEVYKWNMDVPDKKHLKLRLKIAVDLFQTSFQN